MVLACVSVVCGEMCEHVGGDVMVVCVGCVWLQGHQEEEGTREGGQGKEGEASQESEGPECSEAATDRILHLLVSGGHEVCSCVFYLVFFFG